MKHTQGEWEHTSNGVDRFIVKCKGDDILKDVPFDEAEANAKLITAAPEMLEALIQMVKLYEEVEPAGGYQGYYDDAVIAIKKATK